MKTITTIGILAAAVAASPVVAQQGGMAGMDHSQMQGMDHSKMMQPTPANPYGPDMMKMNEKMMSAMGAEATETWVRKMVEHHRGGIAMSRIVLRETKDPKVRQMATKTIAEQTREIGELNAWLRAHGKSAQ